MGLVAVTAEPEQQLAWEARQRPRAAIAAIVAGFLTLAGYLWAGLGLRDTPARGLPRVARHARQPGPIGTQPSLKTAIFEYYDEQRVDDRRLRHRPVASRCSPSAGR